MDILVLSLTLTVIMPLTASSMVNLFDRLNMQNNFRSSIHLSKPRIGYKYPFQDPSLPWETRVDDLAGRLTMEEIVNQTTARYGHRVPSIERLGIKQTVYNAECLRGYARRKATSFPQSIGLAAAFSEELLHAVGEAVGDEVRAYHNTGQVTGLTCFSPVINILRHPLWGRNQETYGEDPFLSGELGAAYVRGLQGDHPRYLRVSAGCKHFDAHGGPDNIPVRKFGFNANITQRDLQMTFLPQFEACIAAEPYNVMCSFNSINGVPSCASRYLMTDVLRKQWGYRGFVISDDSAVEYVYSEHHYNDSYTSAAVEAVKTGCNVELVGKFQPAFWNLPQAVKDKLISEEEMRQNIKPVLYTRMRLGEFDPDDMNPYTKIPRSTVLSKEHIQLAAAAAEKTFVLMKNENNTLPLLMKIKNLTIVGPMANDKHAIMGDYAASPPQNLITTPYDGLRGLADNTKFASGCDDTKCKRYSREDVQRAVKGSNLVVVCLGTGASVEAENNDRRDINLPGSQLQLLKDVIQFANGAPIILLLFNAGPLEITFAKTSDRIGAIMECFFPAMTAGDALRRVLTNERGNSSPAGRLPVTWPASLNQVPVITDYTMRGRTYRYYDKEPLYPFGYGLSYSTFSYSDLTLTPSSISQGQSVKVTVKVTNQGPYNADEVIQLYISWSNASVEVPKLQLVGFRRVSTSMNQSVMVSFIIKPRQLAVWIDENQGFVVEPGDILVYAGGQQPNQTTKVPSNVLTATLHVH